MKKLILIGLSILVITGLVSGLGGMLGCAPKAPEKIELTLSNFMPAASIQGVMQEWWGREIERRTNGRVVFTGYYGGALLKAFDTFPGIRDGLADAGSIVMGYHPTDFPLTQALQFSIWDNDCWVHIYASPEVLKEIPELEEEFLANNVIPMYWEPIINVPLGVKGVKIETLDDMKGHQFRSFGGFAQFIEEAGGTSVAMPLSEAYEALLRGAIDGFLSLTVTNIAPMSMHEDLVCDYIIDIGLGGSPWNPMCINKDYWEALPKDIQKVIIEVSEEAALQWVDYQVTQEEEHMRKLLSEGNIVYRLPDAERNRLLQMVRDAYLTDYFAECDKLGLPGRDVIPAFEEALAKYRADSPYVSIFEKLDMFKAEFPNQVP